MFLSSRLGDLKANGSRPRPDRVQRQAPRKASTCRPSIEALEDRSLPSMLTYATFLGGSGDEIAEAIAVDATGNIYVAGATTSANFPATTGAYATSYNGGTEDAFVAKFTATGSLAWATYLGGGGNDHAYGIAVDSSFNVYVSGSTESANFPTKFPYQSTNHGGRDAFVTKLTATGSSLSYSTYLGGSDEDRGFGGIAVDVDIAGYAYVTGSTHSTNFPTASPLQPANGGGADAFVAKLDTNQSGSASLVYSTYLGGSDRDYAYGIAVDSSGVYIAGVTGSNDFTTTAGAVSGKLNRTGSGTPSDGFVAKLAPNGTSLVYSTYLGGGDYDEIWGLSVDGLGNAYVTGYTSSTNFPANLVNAFQGFSAGGTDAFVTKLNPAGTGLMYSTYLGGESSEIGYDIAVDKSSGYAYVTGHTYSRNFPTSHAYDPTYNGRTEVFAGTDAFVAMFDPTASGSESLLDSTYLGGKNKDIGLGIAVDGPANVCVAGLAGSSDFPVTDGSSIKRQDAFVANLGYGSPLLASGRSVSGVNPARLTSAQLLPIVAAAIDRWQAAGVDTSGLGGIQIQVADLGGRTLGLASGHTIWLDDNAAGWGWFVDRTPGNDSEFTTRGNQGEQNRMDLLSVIEHEMGHILGHDHDEGGVMAETLAPGTRHNPVPRTDALAVNGLPPDEFDFAPVVVGRLHGAVRRF